MASGGALVSIGIAAAAGAETARAAAAAAEAAGLHALWINDTPAGDALELIAAAAAVTDRLVLASGVLPVDRRPASEIVARVRDLRLPVDRLMLGIGSGARRVGALDGVRAAAAALREGLGARVVVGALGPRMRDLAARQTDGVLLSWLTPETAARQAAEAHAVDPRAHTALYVRTATTAAGVARMREEADRYARYPAYAANFARLGIDAADTVIGPDALAAGMMAYRAGVDEMVLRAMTPGDTPDDLVRFVAEVAAAV